MNSTLKKESEDRSFPRLMINKKIDIVILFLSYGKGIVVHSCETKYELGSDHEEWNMDYYEDYSGKVILENK